jgi:hypothetical protein
VAARRRCAEVHVLAAGNVVNDCNTIDTNDRDVWALHPQSVHLTVHVVVALFKLPSNSPKICPGSTQRKKQR